MLAKEFRVRREKTGVQDLQNAGKVNFGIFRIRMIPMDAQGSRAEKSKRGYTFQAQSEPFCSLGAFSIGKKARTARITISGSI